MKKLFLFFLLFQISFVYSQSIEIPNFIKDAKPITYPKMKHETGSLEGLYGQKYVCYYFDFSDAKFDHKYDLSDYIFEIQNEQNESSIGEISSRFLWILNNELKDLANPIVFRNSIDTKYIAKFYVTNVDEDDGETDMEFMLFNTETEELEYQCRYSGEGGRIGSITNLMGDALEEIAEEMANDIWWTIKRKIKNCKS